MVEYLDPSIANEGEAATDWHPGAGPAPIPDMFKMLGNHKHFGRYFAPHVFRPFPAWIYHATEADMIVSTAKEAKEYGVTYDIEDARYISTGEWKTKPVVKKKPDPHAGGKSIISKDAPQNGGASIEIMAQILQQMQKGQVAPQALNEAVKADPDYTAFLEFKKWKSAQGQPAVIEPDFSVDEPATDLSDTDQKEILVKLAKEKDIHVDKRWGLDKIKAVLDAAA